MSVSAFAWFQVPTLQIRDDVTPIQYNVYGNCNNFGPNNGMINCGTVNLVPVSRRLDNPNAQGLKQQILSFPRNKSYNVTSVWGDQEAFQFATDIFDFMKANNFTVDGVDQAMFNKPVTGLSKQDGTNGKIEIIVGARPN